LNTLLSFITATVRESSALKPGSPRILRPRSAMHSFCAFSPPAAGGAPAGGAPEFAERSEVGIPQHVGEQLAQIDVRRLLGFDQPGARCLFGLAQEFRLGVAEKFGLSALDFGEEGNFAGLQKVEHDADDHEGRQPGHGKVAQQAKTPGHRQRRGGRKRMPFDGAHRSNRCPAPAKLQETAQRASAARARNTGATIMMMPLDSMYRCL
jgi:hypothetical protein